MLALLDLDPNIVKPGWTPLLITIALGAAIVLLYLSLRKQFRRIEKNFPMPEPHAAEPVSDRPGDAAAVTPEKPVAPTA